MEETEFQEKLAVYEAKLEKSPEDIEALTGYGSLMVERALFLSKEGENDITTALLRSAEERLQKALELDESNIMAYKQLSRIFFLLSEWADTPEELNALLQDGAIYELGSGSLYLLGGDLNEAREHFNKSFEVTKDTSKISVVPFAFVLGLDYLAGTRPNDKTLYAAKQIEASAILCGHEEVGIICRALILGKLMNAKKPTMIARASFELAGRIVEKMNLGS